MSGKILGLDHLGIAVRDPRERLAFWADVLGMPLERVEAVPSEGVRTWFVEMGGAHVELLEALDESSPIAKALDKRGEGVHHVCLRVDDIEAVLARLVAKGLEPIGGGARDGAGGCRVAFLHPKQTGGVLLELSQPPVGVRKDSSPFAPGAVVVLYLREPREKLFGVLESLDARGIALRGLDLEAWDDWLAQHSRGETTPLSASVQFFPTHRMEKLLADAPQPGLPSLSQRFEERTRRDLRAALSGAE